MPAITKNTFGKGCTYYIGTNMGQEGIDKVLKMATQQAGVHPVVKEPTALEVYFQPYCLWQGLCL